MAYIKTMKDANGNVVYPQTHVKAVYAADGETLETKLNNLPTKVSELENDTGFITSTVNNLTNYYKKTETYTQDEVKGLINAITTLNIEVVAEKPTENISTTTIYLIGTDTEADNDFEEWIYTNGNWELIGTTAIDLTPYATKEYVNTALVENQADWNQNDETAANYIENRTHYVISNEKSSEDFYAKAFSETDWVANNTIYGYQEIINDASKTLIPNCGTYLSIDYDGIEYIVEVKKFPSTWGKIVYVGNLFLLTQTEDYVADEANFFLDQIVDTKEPFLITFGTEVPM